MPEPDAGIRKMIDEVLHREGLQNNLNIVLEVGGWATILAYVRDGFGVGFVSEGAVVDTKGLVIRLLDLELLSSHRNEADLPAAGRFG